VEEERRAAFEESGNHFESGYHLTLVYLPPEESRARAAGMLYENRPTEGVDWRERLQAFVAETDRVFDLLDGVMPEIDWLDDSQTLTYLHATISTRRYRVGVPEVPFHIDALLTDSALVGGLAPMLGDQHLRVVSVRGFPTSTWPGILDDLNRLGFAYRWSTRFLCLDKAEAERELGRLRRQWFAKRKNVIALLRETIFQQESPLVDTDANNKAADADAALQELGSDQVAFGYLTATVTVMDEDAAVADEKLRMVERVIQGRGFVTIPETLNAVDAWLSSIPGNAYANVRQPIVSTLNLAHMMPVSAVWAGPEKNDHLDGPPLIVTRTDGATPFRLVTHIGDVGHTLVAARPAWASRSCSPRWRCSSAAIAARASSPSTWGARCAPRSSGWAASTTTWAWMARSPSSRWPASTARATAPGRPNGSKAACCTKAWQSAPTRRRPSGRRWAASPVRRWSSAR
jgi:type IV secretory pathway VirB4 component